MKKEYNFHKAKRGAVIPQTGKTRITIYLDDQILDAFRDHADRIGKGYQTLINEALRVHLSEKNNPVDEKTLRKVIREELKKVS